MAEIVTRFKRKSSQSPLDNFWFEINERGFKRPLREDFAKLSISDFSQKEMIKSQHMDESSSAVPPSKLVVVRVKRKTFQSPLDAFWLEINKRPVKRPLSDFENLSISNSAEKVEFHVNKVFMQHLKTISSSEVTFGIVQSIVDSGSSRASESKSKVEERKNFFIKDNCTRKQDKHIYKAKQDKEFLAKDTPHFEQIWKSRKGNKGTEDEKEKALLEICNLYDIVHVEKIKEVQQEDTISLEDKMLLSSFLPLLRETVPNAASEIEGDSYVYDLYTEMDVEGSSYSYHPLVQVDEEEEDFYDGPDHSNDLIIFKHPVNDEDLEHHAIYNHPVDVADPSYVGDFDNYVGMDGEGWS